MRVFVQWVLSQRYWLVLAAVVFAPLPVVACALMVLNTLHRGPSEGLWTALAASTGLVLLAVVTAGEWREVEVRRFEPDEKNRYGYAFVVLERATESRLG